MPYIRRLATLLTLSCTLHLPAAMAREPLNIHIYLHDELSSISEQAMHNDYFKHWEDEMHAFATHPIEVIFHRNIAGITDINYAASNSAWATLDAFHHAVADKTFSHYPRGINKSLLVTENEYEALDSGKVIQGLAMLGGSFAIASRTTYANPAHEIGHMLGATHEDAEKQIKIWPLKCETYVYPERAWDRANCYRYSDANRENIKAHLLSHSR
ncbi:hypothetical protein [Pseudomonas sp. MN1F]|uniref:hypothetical protein n=1 Tax=Pseudomonas sp. MN1F TaxID=1366632 RepID=UPI00128FB8A8|nr:hypothetical protein [Pseudomonas sp. MN1F]MQG94594.1 hypothetical protein [Pseudomonas sp. MN1F]